MRKAACAMMVAAAIGCSAAAHGAELRISGDDTVESVLKNQKGRVTVRLRSGQELTGTVRSVTPRLVHLGGLSGREFFDAVVPIGTIEAVIVRTRE